jgi:hypothetical protein
MDKVDKMFTDCDCYSHGIVAEFDDWGIEDNEDRKINDLCLAFYEYGHNYHKRSIWNRIKNMWHIFRTGTPYTDMVILNKDKSLKLALYILDGLDKNYKEKYVNLLIDKSDKENGNRPL